MQAQARTERAAQGLRNLSDQLQALAEGRPQEAGNLADVARNARGRVTQVADRLEAGGVDGALDDLALFARRRPWAFLGLCAAGGFVLGRVVRAARNDGQPALSVARSESSDARPGLAAGGMDWQEAGGGTPDLSTRGI